MQLTRYTATILLVVATMFWGFAFIAQKTAMDVLEPLSFIGARYLLGGLAILPFAIKEYKKHGKPLTQHQWWFLIFLSLNFFLGSWLQQAGLVTTTVTNGGFLTGLYVFFVPFVLMVFFKTRPHNIVWFCAPLALTGLYFLNGGELDAFNSGDTLIIISAVFWALHVLTVGFLSRATGLPIFISCISFLAAGAMAIVGALTLETPTLEAFSLGWVEIVYAGVFSTAIAFTLQAVGQVHVPPENAAIILSGEALFAALGAAVILGERLTTGGYFGAGLMFLAIVLVETVPAFAGREKSPKPSS